MKKVLGLVVLIKIWIVYGNLDYLDVEVEYQCIQHCPSQNWTDAGHYDYACNYGCNINQCNKGCKLWQKALNSSCQRVCNEPMDRLTPKELFCVMGCNDAMTKYFSQLKSKLLIPPAPALVADSLNATSLKLEWNFPEAKRVGLTQHVQWKYEELTATWHYCRNATWNQDETVVIVENLQPYTKYRFRIVLILGHQENSITSIPSVVISTLPSGIPVSPPSSVRVAPIDSTRISVSWEPGPFPHGPLLSYVLQITDNQPDAVVPPEVKDIPADRRFYMIKNLRAARNYTISLKMINGVGPGPSTEITVATPPESLVKETQQPVLILGTEHSVIKQGTNIADEPEKLYSTLMTIKGIGIHIDKKLIFISDSGGYVIKMPLSKNHYSNYSLILTPSQINFTPLELSVDWLNDQLYILGEVKRQQQRIWQIARCDLNGRGLTIAVAGLQTEPYNIEVDPYNGYLFWAIHEHRAGIYRLDISDISNGIKHDVRPVLILQDENLGAFTVDHTNFRLFVANETQKTINAVSLDGKEITNVRPNVITSKLQKVVSLATAHKKFYWTDGDDIFFEEYHNSDYFHNSYPDLSARSYRKVIVNLTSSQPIPSPVNPPTNVQAIFGSNVAKATWQLPHLLGIQGKGAWQNWSYEIAIKEVDSEDDILHKTTNTTSYKISGLKESTEYIIKVAAYTKSGKGPWSSEFRGLTLSSFEKPVIYWSAAKGLLKSDATGENVETLIHKSQMKSFYFIDMTWYKNQIYLVTNNSHVYWYNTQTHNQGQLIDLDSVGSIAVDWIGMKLYWSNPKRQMIIRGNLNGTQQEPLPILTLAKELNIDSVKAYLYWSTGFAVKCAHLNGENPIEYHPVQLFSGRQVMGLTLDINNKFVYWIVRGSEGSNLFKAPMAGYSNTIQVEKISSLQKPNMQGPLCYFHKRLLWLQDDKNAAISDLQGKNIATISGKSMSDLTLVYVVDSSLHFMPDDSNEPIIVIPEMVDETSVRVIGSSNSFNVTWDRVANVNYGEVFYEVSIDSLSRNDSTLITSEPTIKFWQQVAPFTKLHVAIRAFTYWGSSPQIRAKVYSPASTPSVPRNLRAYVTHPHNTTTSKNVNITVRWDPPLYPNGVIKGYKVFSWYYNNSNRISFYNSTVRAEDLQIELKYFRSEPILEFQIQAYNEEQDGDKSGSLLVNSSHESPLPRLLMASSDSIFIQDIDSDKSQSLLDRINTPIEITYLIKESKLFWINQGQFLMMYEIKSSKKTKLIHLKISATSLTIDWLERSLYYVQAEDSNSCIFKLDLNQIDQGASNIKKIFCVDDKISKVEVSPYTRKLYWVEKSKLMVCDTDGFNRREFFKKNHQKRSIDCNCPCGKIEDTYTLDHSTETKPELIFVDSSSQAIFSSDRDGCSCSIIANNSMGVVLPLERLKSDFGTLYWTKQGVLHALKKNKINLVTKEVNVHDIVIYGPHVQPFPPKECLKPRQHQYFKVRLVHKTSNSLTVKMPEIQKECNGNSMPTVEFRIYYKQQIDDNINCDTTCYNSSTFEDEYTIRNLKPFTNYIVAVAVRNYYTEEEAIILGPSVVVQTAVGAPSQPQNITAVVLNPTTAKVFWWPPQQFNGATVHYEIYLQTEHTLSGVRQKEQPNVEQQFSPKSTQMLTTTLSKLSPNETYTIWVRACSETNEISSDSEKVQINTYPEPSDLILVNKTAHVLVLTWEIHQHVENYSVQFSPLTSNQWEDVIVENSSDDVLIVKEDLNPKTHYKFRLSLFFENYSEEYIWPTDSRFTYETLGDKPSPPGIPKIQNVKPNIFKIWWEPSRDNGAPIELYKLEGLQLPNYRTKRSTNRTAFFYTAPSIEVEEREWLPFYNGTETSWIIDGLSDKFKYEFRALALNAYGWSEPSDSSIAFDLNEAARMAEKQSPMALIVAAICIPVSLFLLILLCIVCRKWRKPKKVQVVSVPRGPDVELATLRELPRRGIHNTNVLYVSTQPSSDELTLLPHIRRDQITLTKFLGSGAFGEVFEGKARGILNGNCETKVAVKTLRKGATDQEKTEFLQEAQLMSNFKHEHILQLLGVCLDNDPHFIIMELMQGGDLLTYLRSSRNPNIDTPRLSLMELLKMCVDVARGCRYLEEMHFVHRDLACRNCLVSSKEADRIVKIGDFGLARDIYKNDYYRKEGEGLLPVRWMAPESLVDGVFTSQSDVWAFGVLLWEIMTLGQQPYPARNNLEVLHYVRRGGRLGKPTDCPETLHNLMLKCWEFEAEKRPTFKYCLDVLDNLHFQKLNSPTTGAHEGQYISTVQEYFEGISNEAYFRDENFNAGDIDDDTNREKTPFLSSETPSSIPKYLELLYEAEAPPNDGYEIPNQILNVAESTKRSSSMDSIPNETNRCNGTVPEVRNKSLKKVKCSD